MSEVWINDVDLTDYGFALGVNPDHQASPTFTDASIALIGAVGPTWAGEPTQAASRRITIAGNVRLASPAALLTAVDTLKQLAATGAVRIRLADRPTQEFRDARHVSFTAPPRAAILSNLAADISVVFECLDPLRYDVQPQGIALSTGRAALPQGTAATFPLIIVHGGGSSLTNPFLTYRSAAGDALQTFGITGVLGVNDYVIIDCLRARLIKSVAGVQTDTLAWFTGGDFFALRPADGYYELGQFPTLELSSSAGAPVGVAIYSKAWL